MSIRRALALTSLVVAPAVALACGSSSSGSGEAGNGTDAGNSNANGGDSGGNSQTSDAASTGDAGGTFTEGAHAPFPTMINHGVPVVATPKIVAVTFNDDTNASGIASYVSSLGTTSYWQSVMKDYAVGAATGSAVAVTATLEASYSDNPGSATLADGGVATWPAFVQSTIENTANGIPAPDDNTIYVFFVPSTTSIAITVQGTATSTCTNVGGYHSAITSGGKTILYATINECANATFGNRTFPSELDFVTFASSHEIVEAATDPTNVISGTTAPTETGGWYNDELHNTVDDVAWADIVADGEVADFCVDQFGLTTQHDTTTAGTNIVQRIWSVSAATAGKNPCIPVPSGEIYFNASPTEGNDLFIATENTPTTLNIQAFSDAPKTWTLIALDASSTASLTMSFVGGTTETETGLNLPAEPAIPATNGKQIQLSITLTAALSNDNPFAAGLLISHDGTDLPNATNNHYWPFLVTTEAIATGQVMHPIHMDGLQRANIFRKLQQLRAEH